MSVPSPTALEALEQRVRASLADQRSNGLEILGYGEVTTVLGLDDGGRRYAVKRLPPFEDAAEAQRHVEAVEAYVQYLRARGLAVVPTELRSIACPDGRYVLYLVQPRLEPAQVGPEHLRRLDEAGARRSFLRIFDALERSVTPEAAPDGQLSNWAFDGDEPVYLDVSTPFVRHLDGRLALDWSFFVRTMPPPLRPVLRAEIPRVVAKYCDLRHQVRDFLANLKKERLAALIPPLLDEANRRLERPITRADVDRYYARDARTYAALQGARRGHRWVTRTLLRRPYPVLLPPPIQR